MTSSNPHPPFPFPLESAKVNGMTKFVAEFAKYIHVEHVNGSAGADVE
jgi:hypothetical protein